MNAAVDKPVATDSDFVSSIPFTGAWVVRLAQATTPNAGVRGVDRQS